jgi:hypothetical protein
VLHWLAPVSADAAKAAFLARFSDLEAAVSAK